MTLPHLARNQQNKVTLRRRNAFKKPLSLVHRRRTTGGNIKTYLKKQLRIRAGRRSRAVADSSPWAVSFTSWTTLPGVTTSDIYPFHSWSILDEDIGNDDFLRECMRLYSLWTWTLTIEEEDEEWMDEEEKWMKWSTEGQVDEEETEGEVEEEWNNATDSISWSAFAWSTVAPFRCRFCEEELSEQPFASYSDSLEEGMQLFATWTVEEQPKEIVIKEDLRTALVSAKQLVPLPSAGVMRALLSPDVLMASLAVLLFETRHLQYINERLALPPPPAWMIEAAVREMDPPNTAVSTVSLPSGWDVLSARLSTSSIFNLFSDVSSPSLFSIDPTGVSTTSSTSSVTALLRSSSSVSSLSTDPSCPSSVYLFSSSVSSLSTDPSCPCSSPLSSLFDESISDSSLDSHHCSICPDYGSAHLSEYDLLRPSDKEDEGYDSPSQESLFDDETDGEYIYLRTNSTEDDQSYDDQFERSRHTYVVSSAESGYESDADSEPVALKKMTTTVSTSTQTEAATSQSSTTRMLAECDALMEKIVEMRKKLREMM